MKAGADLSKVDDVDAWLSQNTAFRDDGTVIVLASETPADDKDDEPERKTETQKAVTEGDPKLPPHVHRNIMNPVGAKSAVDNFDAAQLADPKYRDEVLAEIGESSVRDLRLGLQDRNDAVMESGVYDNWATVDVPGDVLQPA